MGEFQFKFFENKDKYKNDGYVFLEAANINAGTETCNWENKALFKLGENDIASILHHLKFELPEEGLKLFHKTETKNSTLLFKDGTNGSISMNLSNSTGQKVSMFLKPVDITKFIIFMDECLRRLIV